MTILFALIGAILFILIQLKFEKDKHDKANKPMNWASFLSKNWDDFIFAVVCALILGWLQDPVYSALIHWQEWEPEQAWDIYYDTELLISVALGAFGTLIIQQVWKLGVKIIGSKS